MLRKPTITATLPDHIVEEIERHAKALQISKAEYLALLAKWWYGQGSPAVTEDEARLARDQKGRNVHKTS